jgi:hypothetical protein
MARIAPTSRWSILAEGIVRFVWAALAAVHVLPLWRVSGRLLHDGLSPSSVGLWLVLAGLLALFLLKSLGVPFLRVRCSRTALLALLVCFGLAHGDDAAQWAKDPAHAAATWALAGTAGAVTLAHPVIRRRAGEFLKRAGMGRAPRPAEGLLCFADADRPWRANPFRTGPRGVPRGPPRV